MGGEGRRTRTIQVDALARVEGEGALRVEVRDGRVTGVALSIFEPPRYFEAFLRGRDFREAPDITSRICGICPVAYQMSAVHAMERALGVTVDGALRALRRLIYCGEWVESHALHAVMLHAPDFLGFEGVVDMAREHGEAVRRGLRLKKAGNALMTLLGGREVHPINVRVGGFYRVPTRAELLTMREPLERALEDALATLRWAAGFEFPELERGWELVALRGDGEYPMNEGRVASTAGLDVPIEGFEARIEEFQVAHSTALHARRRGGGAYLTGPLARFALNADRLSPLAREAAREVGLDGPCRNPFRSVLVRLVEVVYAVDEALRLIDGYEPPPQPAVEVTPRAATGCAATEAPRGLLYHRYRLGADGRIEEARIVPPTSQNQPSIEADLWAVAEAHVAAPDAALRAQAERAIRNHDPCISCAAHFLTLEVDRG